VRSARFARREGCEPSFFVRGRIFFSHEQKNFCDLRERSIGRAEKVRRAAAAPTRSVQKLLSRMFGLPCSDAPRRCLDACTNVPRSDGRFALLSEKTRISEIRADRADLFGAQSSFIGEYIFPRIVLLGKRCDQLRS
jgi:hypothetical protein